MADTLLNSKDHPVGTRLLMSYRSAPPRPDEATVIEWAPSSKLVKVRYETSLSENWLECTGYDPVVIEVLPAVKP